MHWSENTLMLEASYIGHQFILFTKIIADALISHLKTAKYRRSEQLQLFIECLMRRWFSWKMFVRHTFKKVVAMWMAELETCQSARRRVDCQKWRLGNSLWRLTELSLQAPRGRGSRTDSASFAPEAKLQSTAFVPYSLLISALTFPSKQTQEAVLQFPSEKLLRIGPFQKCLPAWMLSCLSLGCLPARWDRLAGLS